MSTVFLAIGAVMAIEGLAFALAPTRFEDLLAIIASLSQDRRRVIGLITMAVGVALIWLARNLAA